MKMKKKTEWEAKKKKRCSFVLLTLTQSCSFFLFFPSFSFVLPFHRYVNRTDLYFSRVYTRKSCKKEMRECDELVVAWSSFDVQKRSM